MKKQLLFGFAMILFVACQNQPQRYFESSPEIDALKAGIKAYEEQDWTTWKSHFADTAKVYHNTDKGVSPSEQMESMKAMLSNFSSYGFLDKEAFSEMVIDKDQETWVNYWGNWTGKLKANDEELNIPVHLTAQFIDGKIVKEYAYYDTSKMVLALQEMEAEKSMAEQTETTEQQLLTTK